MTPPTFQTVLVYVRSVLTSCPEWPEARTGFIDMAFHLRLTLYHYESPGKSGWNGTE
jgi:hypothetical protein